MKRRSFLGLCGAALAAVPMRAATPGRFGIGQIGTRHAHAAGKIAAIAPSIDPADATRTLDVRGLVVTPGLVDIHAHVYTGTGEPRSYAGDNRIGRFDSHCSCGWTMP